MSLVGYRSNAVVSTCSVARFLSGYVCQFDSRDVFVGTMRLRCPLTLCVLFLISKGFPTPVPRFRWFRPVKYECWRYKMAAPFSRSPLAILVADGSVAIAESHGGK